MPDSRLQPNCPTAKIHRTLLVIFFMGRPPFGRMLPDQLYIFHNSLSTSERNLFNSTDKAVDIVIVNGWGGDAAYRKRRPRAEDAFLIVKRKPRDRRVVEKRLTGEKKSSDVLK